MFQTAARMLVTIALAAPAWAQQPPIQNGRVEARQPADLAGELSALAGKAAEPVWAGWRVPIAGVRSLCNWYVDDSVAVRGFLAATGQPGASPVPTISPPTGPVPIEAGTGLVVLVRLKDGEVERLRTLTDDCPIDAGGRTIYWYENVTPARSLAYLEGLTRLPDSARLDRRAAGARRSLAQSAISAVALHADAGADPILDRIAGSHPDSNLRRHAATRIGAERGARGFDALRRLIGAETDQAVRRALVGAMAQIGPPAAETLLTLARGDANAGLRGDAAYHYIRVAGAAGVDSLLAIVARDADDGVRKRAIQGLASLPNDAGVPHLIALARASKDARVRKEAVSRLGRTKDPRAVAYLTEILSGGQGRR